jgi:hypothetical protein
MPLASVANEQAYYGFSESVMLPEQRMTWVDWTADGHYLFEGAAMGGTVFIMNTAFDPLYDLEQIEEIAMEWASVATAGLLVSGATGAGESDTAFFGFRIFEDGDYSERLTYPSYLASWSSGVNDELTENLALFTLMDTCTLMYRFAVDADAFEGARDQLYAVLDGLSIEENTMTAQAAPITGLVLVGDLPLKAELVTNTADEQGNYMQELMAYEGAVSLVTLRQKIDEGHPIEMTIEGFLSEYFFDIRDAELLETDPVAAYPAERIRFVTGAEEDTAVIDAVIIRTDEFFFAFWADIQIDIYYGYRDAFAEGEVPELIDMWIESLDLFDSGEPLADDEPPYWNGFDFGPNLVYAEEYVLQGDPGDYLNAAEAAKLTFEAMRDNGNIPDYSDGMQYTLTLADLTDVNGEECYVYRLDADDPEGTIGAAYAYAYQSGNIYMQGFGGEWVQP